MTIFSISRQHNSCRAVGWVPGIIFIIRVQTSINSHIDKCTTLCNQKVLEWEAKIICRSKFHCSSEILPYDLNNHETETIYKPQVAWNIICGRRYHFIQVIWWQRRHGLLSFFCILTRKLKSKLFAHVCHHVWAHVFNHWCEHLSIGKHFKII